jgi:hypothetical protein
MTKYIFSSRSCRPPPGRTHGIGNENHQVGPVLSTIHWKFPILVPGFGDGKKYPQMSPIFRGDKVPVVTRNRYTAS